MKVPDDMTFYAPGGPYNAGDDIPDAVLAALPADHPFRAAPSAVGTTAPRAAPRPAPTPDGK